MSNEIEKEYFVNEMNSFIKHIFLIILNSRINQNNLDKESKNITLKLFSIEQEKNFDIEEIFDFEHDYIFLASPNQIRQSLSEYNNGFKSYQIDIFLKEKNKLILKEKWFFSFLDDIQIFIDKINLEKILKSLTRSVYSITRFLPLFYIHKNNLQQFEYKAYTNDITNNEFNGKTNIIQISNKKMRINFKVEYQVDNNFKENKLIKNKSKKIRYNSLTLTKKTIPSFEVLLTEDEIEYYKNNSNEKDSPKIRKLSHDFDKENNPYKFLSIDEIKNLGPNLKYKDEGSFSENSGSSLELNIKNDSLHNSSTNIIFNEIKQKYKNFKDKYLKSNEGENNGININKLYIYTILDFNFN